MSLVAFVDLVGQIDQLVEIFRVRWASILNIHHYGDKLSDVYHILIYWAKFLRKIVAIQVYCVAKEVK